MSTSDKTVSYADLLGFSTFVASDLQAAEDLLSAFYSRAQNVKLAAEYAELELLLFSDFLFVQGLEVRAVVNYMCDLYRAALCTPATTPYRCCLEEGSRAVAL
jgi:hypothetical protein